MSLDRLSNMISSIKNAAMAKKAYLELPHTGTCEDVAKVLKENGFLTEVKVFKEKGQAFKSLRLDIAYDQNGTPLLSDIKRVSKPGKRVYTDYVSLGHVASGYGLMVVSTSRGITTGLDARKRKLGGEVILKAW